MNTRDAKFLAKHRALGRAEGLDYPRGNSDIIDVAAEKRGETERAWKIFDGTRTEWVPKSQVEDNGDGTYAMPEWLAKEKGFI